MYINSKNKGITKEGQKCTDCSHCTIINEKKRLYNVKQQVQIMTCNHFFNKSNFKFFETNTPDYKNFFLNKNVFFEENPINVNHLKNKFLHKTRLNIIIIDEYTLPIGLVFLFDIFMCQTTQVWTFLYYDVAISSYMILLLKLVWRNTWKIIEGKKTFRWEMSTYSIRWIWKA